MLPPFFIILMLAFILFVLSIYFFWPLPFVVCIILIYWWKLISSLLFCLCLINFFHNLEIFLSLLLGLMFIEWFLEFCRYALRQSHAGLFLNDLMFFDPIFVFWVAVDLQFFVDELVFSGYVLVWFKGKLILYLSLASDLFLAKFFWLCFLFTCWIDGLSHWESHGFVLVGTIYINFDIWLFCVFVAIGFRRIILLLSLICIHFAFS